jgi:CHASE2 domain-containing sensor protein
MDIEQKEKKGWLSQVGENLVRRCIVAALAFIIMGLYAMMALNLKLFNPISKAFADYSITDFYYDVSGHNEADTSNIVTIVDMTELPNRAALAMVLDQIAECKPKAIGVDVVFEGLKEEFPEGDTLIFEVAHSQPKTVFSYKMIDDSWDGTTYHQTKRSFFADSLITQGFTNMPRNIYGGMKRQLSVGTRLNGKLVPSLIKAVADEYAGEETVPLEDRNVRINFKPRAYAVVPPDSVYEYRHLIEDRIVLYGAMTEEADMHYTPMGKIAGVKLLAYAIETLLKHNEIKEVPMWVTWLLNFLLMVMTILVFDYYDRWVAKRGPLAKVLWGSLIIKGFVRFFWMAVFMWLAFLLFSLFDISLNMAYGLAAVAFMVTANNLYSVLAKYFEDKKQRKNSAL